MAGTISSALARQCEVPYCRLSATNIVNAVSLCPGHMAAVRGRLVRMRVPLDEFKGDALQLLRTEYQAPVYSTTGQRMAAGAALPGRIGPVEPRHAALDPSTECECRHSFGAHARANRECSFCACPGFQEWINPEVVAEKPLFRDVAQALGKLAQQPGFRDLEREHLMALGRYGRRRFFAHGSILFDRGDAGDRVYLMLSGEVQTELPLEAGRERVVQFQPGEIVGTRALFRGGEHVATIRAVKDVFALELTREEVRDSFRRNTSLALAFMRMIRARMTARNTRQPATPAA